MRQVIELPVTMSFERDGGAAVRDALAAFGAAERLVQPSSCSLFVDGIDRSWHLYREQADASDDTESGRSADGEDDDDDLEELDDDGRLRPVERIDSAVVAALLGEALDSYAAGQTWELSIEGGDSSHGSPRPFLVRIQAQPDGIALHVEVRCSSWSESGSAGRAGVEQLGRDLEHQGWQRVELDAWSHTDPTATAGRTDARILDESVDVDLHWAGPAADGELEKAGLVISAIAALAPILRPRQLMMLTSLAGAHDARSSGASRTSPWILQEDPGGPSQLDHGGMGFRSRVSVDHEAMLELTREALAPRRPPGLLGWTRGKRAVSWSDLEASHALVRLPDAERFSGRSSLCVLAGRRELSLPLVRRDDGLWVSLMRDDLGEDEPEDEDLDVTGPISVWARAEGPTLQIRLHWSLWAYPGSLGRVLVDRALAALIRLGWQRTTYP